MVVIPVLLLLALPSCDDPSPNAASEKALAEALKKPGKFGPVPTGKPGDPFHITKIKIGPFDALDSGPGLISGDKPFYWIDDQRLLFHANNGRHHPTSKAFKASGEKGYIFVWNIEEGIKNYWEEENYITNYCHADGYIEAILNYILDEKNKISAWRRRLGPMGSEKDWTLPNAERTKLDKEERRNPFTCGWIPRPPETISRMWTPLRPGDGYLDQGTRKEQSDADSAQYRHDHKDPDATEFYEHPRKARLINREKGIDRETKVPINFPSGACLRYFTFKGAYFSTGCGFDYYKLWQRSNCRPAWWIYPDGRSEKVCIPAGPYAGGTGSAGIIPTKNGYLVYYHGFNHKGDPGDAGLYWIKDGKWQRLLSGWLEVEAASYAGIDLNVSPDGCRVAFSYAPTMLAGRLIGPGPSTTRILNVCSGGGTPDKAGG